MSEAPKPASPAAPDPAAEKKALEERVITLERENKSLAGQLSGSSPEAVAELQKLNKELKTTLVQVQKDLAAELATRKFPMDAAGISDKLQVLKSGVVTFCTDRQIDPALWKKLESL